MTTVNDQKRMFRNAAIISNIMIMAARVNRELDEKYLNTCGYDELSDCQQNLIEAWNAQLLRDNR